MVKDGTLPSGGCKVFACPFNDDASSKYIFGEVCVYMVRITEVFIGDYSVSLTYTRCSFQETEESLDVIACI